jgi:ribosomal-protein-alanine N-acetyltransferase
MVVTDDSLSDTPRRRFVRLEGEKTVLMPFAAADISADYVGWLGDPEVVRYSNQRFVTHSAESCARYLESFAGTGNLFLKILRKSDGVHVGTMTAYYSVPHRTVDVGIMVGRRDAWGKGIGQDAWNTLLAWLLEQACIRKLTAGTMRCNGAMVRLMERSGMSLEAVRPDQELLDGAPQDLVYYGKFPDR